MANKSNFQQQNYGKTKRRIETQTSEMITMNTLCILKGNQVQFTVSRSTDATLCPLAVMFGEINTTSVDHVSEREFDHEHASSSTIKLRENEKENKNSTF